MNKTEFMNLLENGLLQYGVTDSREIIADFEQHFIDGLAAGETEEQVCEKLGDPKEIAEQYASEDGFGEHEEKEVRTEPSGFDNNTYQGSQTYNYGQPSPAPTPTYQQTNTFSPDGGKQLLVIMVDIFVFTWAIPSLISLILALYALAIGFFGAGVGTVVGGILMTLVDTGAWFFSSLSPISTVLFGVMALAACSLLVIASIAATKGFINICKRIINWHSMTFSGRNVCTIKKKEAA